MPPKAKTHCAFEGCTEPRHVYPGGAKSSFCAAHHKCRQKSRKGVPSITQSMRNVLHHLIDARSQHITFVELSYPLAPGKTIRALLNRGWIAESFPGWYAITELGLRIVADYETPINRRDGICPRCQQRERHIQPDGRQIAYCLECERARTREKTARHKTVDRSDRLCPRCQKRPRHQYPGGGWSAYCLHCETVVRRKNARKNRRLELEAVRAGGPVPICPRCKTRPRMVHPNSISKYCQPCKNHVERSYKFRAVKQLMPLLRKG